MITEATLRSSAEWQDLHPETRILDPDGWDRTNFTFSWYEELITYDEYKSRMCRSTIQSYTI